MSEHRDPPQTAELPVRRGQLVDGFGRVHRDLRVSLTDRCNLRCRYCMPAAGLPWLPRPDLLTIAEFAHLVRLATEMGIQEVRLTGGEPLLHPGVVELVAAIADLPLAPELSLTTNGLRLEELAAPLAAAGLRRVNISLDTLDRDTFRTLALRDNLAETLAGIAAAKRAGLHPIKINTVLLRGINDHEAPALLAWSLEQGLELRFIEQMPLDPQHGWDRATMITREEILRSLNEAGFELTALPGRGSAPAEQFGVTHPVGLAGHSGSGGRPRTHRVGVVGSVTSPFCSACDRVRLTADGQWRSCLFATSETELRTPLRSGAGDKQLLDLMLAGVTAKQAGHGLGDPGFAQPIRPMSAIGG
jgi:GTP 3',8-cyclase